VNRDEAKEILLLYRPGAAGAEDPQIDQAMAVARADPELGRWFETHRAFQKAMRAKFREIEAPEHLKIALLAGQKVIRPEVWWRTPVWLAAAAAIVLLLGLAWVWLRPPAPDRFADYSDRMASMVQREYEYRMDWKTTDMHQLRQKIAAKGGPADYELPKGLEKLKLTGGAVMPWRNNPVAMVCFDRGDKQMLFLFVMKRSAVKDPPPESPRSPRLAKVNELLTASWTVGEKTYLLAGPQEPEFAQKYLVR
jgi:uncharacterized membrane protein YbaN (DUF454 family)